MKEKIKTMYQAALEESKTDAKRRVIQSLEKEGMSWLEAAIYACEIERDHKPKRRKRK